MRPFDSTSSFPQLWSILLTCQWTTSGTASYSHVMLVTLVCRFWLAVQELKKRPIREVPTRVQEIWQEFLAPGAPSAINVDSKSYDKTTQNVKDPGRYAFEDAQVTNYPKVNDTYMILNHIHNCIVSVPRCREEQEYSAWYWHFKLVQTTSIFTLNVYKPQVWDQWKCFIYLFQNKRHKLCLILY